MHGQQQLKDCRTNLDGALREGAAEYVAFQLTGRPGAPAAFAYGKQPEAALRQQVAQEADQPIVAKWFLARPDAGTGQPGALGYFIGFRMGEAYYARASDKAAALQAIITLANLPTLAAASHRYLTP